MSIKRGIDKYSNDSANRWT